MPLKYKVRAIYRLHKKHILKIRILFTSNQGFLFRKLECVLSNVFLYFKIPCNICQSIFCVLKNSNSTYSVLNEPIFSTYAPTSPSTIRIKHHKCICLHFKSLKYLISNTQKISNLSAYERFCPIMHKELPYIFSSLPFLSTDFSSPPHQ